MTYSASESICRWIIYNLQCGRQITVAAEEYLRAWMAKPTHREGLRHYTVITGSRIRGGLFCIMCYK
ncbi:MAG: hypothetical protein HFG88_03985 [Dorea sp.]|nr:hypothetical protein [Dorea sp.]